MKTESAQELEKRTNKEFLAACYERLMKSEDPANELSTISHEFLGDTLDWDNLAQDFAQINEPMPTLCSAIIGRLLTANHSESDFYQKLWEQLTNNSLLEAEDDKLFFLLCILIDQRLPYRRFTMLSMDNDEYIQRQECLKEEIDWLFRLSKRDFAQKTEEASAVLEIIESKSDFKDRVVLLSIYRSLFESETEDVD